VRVQPLDGATMSSKSGTQGHLLMPSIRGPLCACGHYRVDHWGECQSVDCSCTQYVQGVPTPTTCSERVAWLKQHGCEALAGLLNCSAAEVDAALAAIYHVRALGDGGER
jgi:hypothetical protein